MHVVGCGRSSEFKYKMVRACTIIYVIVVCTCVHVYAVYV